MIATEAARDAAERAARGSYGRLVAYLAARCGDPHAAEDALAEAFAKALERWPHDGVPREPDAWLLVAARNRLFDGVRRGDATERVTERLETAAREAQAAFDAREDVEDERLAMLFACAHPALDASVRGPLMLQVVLGLDAARIASAFLVAPATMSQRLVRAKRKIATAGIPLRVPDRAERAERLDAVLDAIYASFAAGWDDPAELDPRTRDLSAEALWLGAMLADLAPDEPEALGLLALMTYASARAPARRDASGAFVPLDEQRPGDWDREAIRRAERVLARAATHGRAGRFQLEAAIASAHVSARVVGKTPDRAAIVRLYDALLAMTKSPVVALNRAVALSAVEGPRAALAALDEVAADARIAGYQPYWAARAALCADAGAVAEARDAFERASALAVDPSVRAYLDRRRASLRASD